VPYRQIREISADADSGLLYLVVDFWLTKAGHANGNPPFLTNDFLMQIPAQETRIITDANGFWQRASDGVFVDPATIQPGDSCPESFIDKRMLELQISQPEPGPIEVA